MKNISRKIELFSNIAIILVALLLGGVLINRNFISTSAKPPAAESKEIKAGTKVSLSDTDWSKSDKTLVLALSTSCHFCSESAPFYKKLAQQKAGRSDVRLIAALPQSVADAQKYLNEQGVQVDEVKQTALDNIYVKGTPTLMIVDRSGTVIESWVGKLPPQKEAEVMQRFFGGQAGD
jgi:thioredoxin-related protein